MGSTSKQKAILVTGASGFVGRHFIASIKDNFIIYALARRSQQDAGVPFDTKIIWLRCDIAKENNLARILDDIAMQGGVDYIFHFAGYYDFTNQDSPEYQRTNVDGTRNILKHANKLQIKRFIFSSSLAVTDFFSPGLVLNENSPPDAPIPYARSKAQAEELIRSYSKEFPCTIVRFAAIFSDWCEYGPLYVLLKNWLSGGLKASFMPGKGESALPYLHVHDLSIMLKKIMEKHQDLAQLEVLVASRSGCVSQKELFDIASRYYYGKTLTQQSIPVWLAGLGVFAMETWGRITGTLPFERVWMLKYTDTKMQVDSSVTSKVLDWHPVERYHITRRMLFLIENMKSNPNLWETRNRVMAHKKSQERPGLKIYEVMVESKEKIVSEHVDHLKDPANENCYPSYSRHDRETLRNRANLIYDMLEVVFLNGNRQHILCYANYLARQRSLEGVGLSELCTALIHTAENLQNNLLNHPDLSAYKERIHDEIGLTLQLILDETEDVYENIGINDSESLAPTAREQCLK